MSRVSFAQNLAQEMTKSQKNIRAVNILPPDSVYYNTDDDDNDDGGRGDNGIINKDFGNYDNGINELDNMCGLFETSAAKNDNFGTFEIEYEEDDDEEENDGDNDVDNTSTTEPPLKILKNNSDQKEPKICTNYPGINKLKFKYEKILKKYQHLSTKNPVELFELFFDKSIYDKIYKESIRYAFQKLMHNAIMTPTDLKKLFGFFILTGYHYLPKEELYWSSKEDFGIALVKNAFNRDKYLSLKRMLHVCNNDEIRAKSEQDFKVSGFYDLLNDRFKQFGLMDECVVVEEQMVKCSDHNHLEKCIKKKSTKFGLKNWCLYGQEGYCYHIQLHTGNQQSVSHKELRKRIVLKLSKTARVGISNSLFIDDSFSSYSLLCQLSTNQIPTIGALKNDRTIKCLLDAESTIAKLENGDFKQNLFYI